MRASIDSMKRAFLASYDRLWRLRVATLRPSCRICAGSTSVRTGYGRVFLECQDCGFIFTGDFPELVANLGMGMVGSWGGAEAGGEREDFLVRMLKDDLGKATFLLYGVGSAVVFSVLMSEQLDVFGCDVSKAVIRYRQKEHGRDRFFHPRELRNRRHRFDVVTACEVFEHFHDPRKWISMIVGSLREGGIVCGTTNLYPGGDIEDGQKVGYMSLKAHQAYWSESSLARAFGADGMKVVSFQMVCPGSVKPDFHIPIASAMGQTGR